jgi:hypothetical protein
MSNSKYNHIGGMFLEVVNRFEINNPNCKIAFAEDYIIDNILCTDCCIMSYEADDVFTKKTLANKPFGATCYCFNKWWIRSRISLPYLIATVKEYKRLLKIINKSFEEDVKKSK